MSNAVETTCEECGRQITIGPDGTEYGHARGLRQREQRCSRRPASVDPTDHSEAVAVPGTTARFGARDGGEV